MGARVRLNGLDGATVNPRLLTLPVRFRNVTSCTADGNVFISASQPMSPQSAPHMSSPTFSVPRPRKSPPQSRSANDNVNPFVNLITARGESLSSSHETASSKTGEAAEAVPKPGDKLLRESSSQEIVASVETAATSVDLKRTRKLHISLARKADGLAQILRPSVPVGDILGAQRRCLTSAQHARKEAQDRLTEARRKWMCAIERVRNGVALANDVLIPELTSALEEAERTLLASSLTGLCLESARHGRDGDGDSQAP